MGDLYIEFIGKGFKVIGQIRALTNPKTRDAFWRIARTEANAPLVDMNLRDMNGIVQSVRVSLATAKAEVKKFERANRPEK